jgi:hypothetical protein
MTCYWIGLLWNSWTGRLERIGGGIPALEFQLCHLLAHELTFSFPSVKWAQYLFASLIGTVVE